MKKIIMPLIVLILMSTLPVTGIGAASRGGVMREDSTDRLAILWTSGDPDVAKKMVFLYAYNAKKYNWFKTIRFIVWGSSAKLLSQDEDLQDRIRKMKEIGIELFACKWCSDSYGVSDLLIKLGVNVIYYGKPLTQLIKDNWKILTF